MANALAWVSQSAYILNQDFESAGIPPGWSSSGGSTFHNTTSPLEGTGDLKCVAPATPEWNSGLSISELWMVLLLKLVSLPSSGTSGCITLYNSSFLVCCAMQVLSTGVIRLINGGSPPVDMVTAATAGTLYYVKAHYKQGSGANSQTSFELSTTGSFVNSGNSYVSTATGNSTRLVTYFDFVYNVDGECRFDHLRASFSDLGNSFSNWP